jgi:hypothetical protein
MLLRPMTLSMLTFRPIGTQHKDRLHNDTQHNNTQYSDTQHNESQPNHNQDDYTRHLKNAKQ